MELIIIEKEPLIQFHTGKWSIAKGAILYYLMVNNVRKEVQPVPSVINYINSVVIEDTSVIGKYDKRSNSIVYLLDMDEHRLVVNCIDTMDNLILIELEANKENKKTSDK